MKEKGKADGSKDGIHEKSLVESSTKELDEQERDVIGEEAKPKQNTSEEFSFNNVTQTIQTDVKFDQNNNNMDSNEETKQMKVQYQF